MKPLARIRRFPSPQDGLRALSEKAPQAEVLAVSWLTPLRPWGEKIYGFRRRIATITVGVLTVVLFVHVMFGANGMVVYKQKRTEYESLKKKIAIEQQENDLFERQVKSLKTDEKAIEKEAREQLGYARSGEYVYVPAVATPAPATNHSAKK